MSAKPPHDSSLINRRKAQEKTKKEKAGPHRGVCLGYRKLEMLLKSWRLLHRHNARTQTGFVARRRVLVQRTLLDRFVEGGNGLAVHLLSARFVALGDGL